MKGKIGGSMRMRSAKDAGVSFRRAGKQYRQKQRRLAKAIQHYEALAARPMSMTPRLRKRD